MRILVVEDDKLLSEGLVSVLTHAGHAVDHTTSGKYADALLGRKATICWCSISAARYDGFEVLRRVRARRSSIGVLVLTARDAVEDRVHGLDLGADDYLTKPFSVAEFEARVRALIRRNAPVAPRISVGAMTVDVAAKRVRINDKQVDLTPREWALLEVFLARPGRVLSKGQIAERLLGLDEPPPPNAIEVHVSRLRTKIESAGVLIRTVRGFGYLWEGAHE
jgi:DNA-binding response OmpR family regulator